eukprot:TRINITY_DN1161_c0_g1_i9.p1 TRINITY_DN1161_c0_g1~~TRINITY_DN1161_c0_g1_i9.p1  ORF type:complete len:480 (-),score=124.91 TRINITY_DN1161_c0_g1_i9:422-1861(-)
MRTMSFDFSEIDLPKAIPNVGDVFISPFSGDSILVLQCFEDYYKKIKDSPDCHYLCGTPGIGKTAFSQYFFLRFCLELTVGHPPSIFVFGMVSFLFENDICNKFKTEEVSLLNLRKDSFIVVDSCNKTAFWKTVGKEFVLTDREKPVGGGLNVRALYVSSPNENLKEKDLKNDAFNLVSLWWPQWNEDNWNKLCSFKKWNENLAKTEKLKEFTDKYGRVPRYVEKFAKIFWDETALSNMDKDLTESFTSTKYSNMIGNNMSYNYAPHHLIFVEPSQDDPSVPVYYFPSSHLEELFKNQLKKHLESHRNRDTTNFNGSFGGWMFEKVGRMQISSGISLRRFKFVGIPAERDNRSGNRFKGSKLIVDDEVVFVRKEPVAFTDSVPISDGNYYYSLKDNYSCIDGVSVDGFFQYTVKGDNHPIKDTFPNVLEIFPSVERYYFVLKKCIIDGFEISDGVVLNGFKMPDFVKWHDQCEFFVIGV